MPPAKKTPTTKPRPEGTKALFINAPEEILEQLDAIAEEAREADPMRRRVTRTDLVLLAIREMIERRQKAARKGSR